MSQPNKSLWAGKTSLMKWSLFMLNMKGTGNSKKDTSWEKGQCEQRGKYVLCGQGQERNLPVHGGREVTGDRLAKEGL